VAQIDPERTYHDWLVDRVVTYLHTGDARLFPFAAVLDEHQRAAFARDLREALADVTDSGSARKTSATGFLTSDQRLQRVIEEWQDAQGGWPEGSYPSDPVTALASSSPVDSPPRSSVHAGRARYPRRVIRDPRRKE
jgi:hypothetical protein